MCPSIFSSYSTLLIFSHNNRRRLFFKATPHSVNNCVLTWHRGRIGGGEGHTTFHKHRGLSFAPR